MLDLDTVQIFVLIAELGSFTRTGIALGLTQAAVSLKLKRLEAVLGERLIERSPHAVRLTPAGEAFLPAARDLLWAHERAVGRVAETPHRLRLALSEHVAGLELPRVLGRLAGLDPTLLIEARIAPPREVLAAYEAGEVEAAFLRRQEARGASSVVAMDSLGWFASPGYLRRRGGRLRLATLGGACAVRAIATEKLAAAGIGWVEVFTGGGVAALSAAVSAGLGVAALARRVAPGDAMDVTAPLGLPILPDSDVVLLSRAEGEAARTALRMLSAALR